MKKWYRFYLSAYEGLSRPAWILALVMFINRVGAMVVPFLGIYMTEALDFTIKEAGIVLSFFGFGSLAGSWLGGKLTDAKGHFKVQLLSLILVVPMFFLLPFFQSVLSLSVGIFLLSLVAETFRPANSVSIAYYSKPENLTRALSLNRMAVNLGFSIGPALGGLLAALSYKFLFYGNGITALLAGLIFYFYFKQKTFKKSNRHSPLSLQKKTQQEPFSPYKSPYRDKVFLLFNFFCTLWCISFFQLLSTLPLFYKEELEIKDSGIGLLLAFNGLVVFIFEMILVHLVEKRWKEIEVIIIGAVLLCLSFCMLQIQGGLWVAYLAMFTLSISEILVMPFMASISLKRATKSSQGAYIGLNGLSFSIAHIVSPYFGTQVASKLGFSNLWLIIAALSMVSSVGFYFLKKHASL